MANLKNLDLNAWFADFAGQFQNLDTKRPGTWPVAPKVAVFIVTAVLTVGGCWVGFLSDEQQLLTSAQEQEPRLKEDYISKLGQAVNLPELEKQKRQVEEYVLQLEKQLPGKAEMDALLSDINQAGLGRGLQFELFRPGQVQMKDYYAEQPISLKVAGRYHDIGAFAADVSNLSRIVTLHNMNILMPINNNNKADPSGQLTLEAIARTYRYLDQGEVEEQQRAAREAAKNNRK